MHPIHIKLTIWLPASISTSSSFLDPFCSQLYGWVGVLLDGGGGDPAVSLSRLIIFKEVKPSTIVSNFGTYRLPVADFWNIFYCYNLRYKLHAVNYIDDFSSFLQQKEPILVDQELHTTYTKSILNCITLKNISYL